MIALRYLLPRRIGALVLGLGLVSAGCSSAQPKPDDVLEAAEAEGEGEEKPDKLDAAEEISLEDSGERAEISQSFQGELNDALQSASAGQRDAAVDRLQTLADDPAGGFLAAFNLGVLYEQEGDYAQAARRYSQALSKNADFSPALLNLVRLYLRLDQLADARKIADQFTEHRPDNMNHRAAALETELYQGKYEDVIRKATQVLRRDETNVQAMLVMAQANMSLERYGLAEAILDRVRELRPNLAETYFKLGQIRMIREEPNDAIDAFGRAIELRPHYPEAHNNLGLLYHEAGDYNAAAEEFTAAVSDFPDYKEAYLNLGNAYKGLADYARAEKAFKKALEIDPAYDKAFFNLGVLYLDGEIEGMEMIARLNASVDYFEQYKSAAASKLSKEDPADKYIREARNSIESEKARQEMMRQAQMEVDDGEEEVEEEE